jgi:protocatechuate 3,4-dioxygenase beta subunit
MSDIQDRPAVRRAPRASSALVLPRYLPTPGVDPPLDSPWYHSSQLRHPRQPLIPLPHTLTEVTGPYFAPNEVTPADADLTHAFGGEAIGQRIIVHGRVLDSGGRPVPHTLVEVWQANAAGRYRHPVDAVPGPLDPHFAGGGRVMTDADGRYRFLTVKPGAYPWRNHLNAWRPAHIHFSLFGRAFTQRLVTQMYFPDDPLFFQDPILTSIPDERAQLRLISRYDHDTTVDQWALGFEWDIVLRGTGGTPFETEDAYGHA